MYTRNIDFVCRIKKYQIWAKYVQFLDAHIDGFYQTLEICVNLVFGRRINLYTDNPYLLLDSRLQRFTLTLKSTKAKKYEFSILHEVPIISSSQTKFVIQESRNLMMYPITGKLNTNLLICESDTRPGGSADFP